MIQSRIIQPELETVLKMRSIFMQKMQMQTHTIKQCWNQLIIQYIIKAIDNLRKNVSMQIINEVLNQNQSETGGLPGILKIKTNARVMLIVILICKMD